VDDPLLTNRLDPALLRVVEKRSSDRETTPRRRRPAVPEKTTEEKSEEPSADTPKHELDDLA
jgi:hypothetical protein